MYICGTNTESISNIKSGRALKNVHFVLDGASAMGTESLIRWSPYPPTCLAAKLVGTDANPREGDT